MNVDKKDHIIEFEEKPKNPKSTLASMGIYIFKYKLLKQFLIKDAKDENMTLGKTSFHRFLKKEKKPLFIGFLLIGKMLGPSEVYGNQYGFY